MRSPVSPPLVLAVVATLGACGGAPPPRAGWTEHEAPLGDHHPSSGASSGGATGSADDTLTPAAIDALDEAAVLAQLARRGDAAPAARLALRAARLAHHRGDDAEARALIARASTAADEAAVHAELATLGAALAAAPVQPQTVAVLLPLTGRFGGLGRELRAAIQIAPTTGTSWLFLDTRGEPDGATAAVAQAHAAGAAGILGPVGSREAIAAARAAALHHLPIALLAPDDGADPAAGVFRLVDSPADEGRAVARLAAQDGFPTVGVFAPRDDLGLEAADAFVAEATRLGLAVTRQGTYDPTGGDVEADLKDFLDLVPARNPRFAQHAARAGKKAFTTFSPDIPYSLLFVPDRHDRAAIVAAFLPYFGVELRTVEFPDPERLRRKHGGNLPQVVQLVGGSGWNHPSLPIRGGSAVQGALVVDAYIGDLGADAGAQFAQAFQARTGRSASAAAAQAHDAALLVGDARQRAAASPAGARDMRAALRAELARGVLDDGACGPAAIDATGELAREPSVLEVQNDQLIVR